MKTEGSHGKVDLRKVQALLTGVVAAAMATIFLLAVFALIVWKMEPSAGAENVGVICVSVLSCFAGGFFCGKKNDTKGFLWGLAVGVLYFVLLLLLRIGSGQDVGAHLFSLFTTFLYCAGSGMLGGMIS